MHGYLFQQSNMSGENERVIKCVK